MRIQHIKRHQQQKFRSILLKAELHLSSNITEEINNVGDQLYFDSSSLSGIMDINGVSYPLNTTALGTLEAGEKSAFPE
jgi:hypothetical protein